MTVTSTKRKRVSKKLKGSWRKHVDINDVEEFLDDQRLEERLGPPLSTMPNDELFRLDTKPSWDLLLSKEPRKLELLLSKETKKLDLLSTKERRKLKAKRPLKCFSALQPHTKVPDPIKKRNRVRTKEERKNDLLKKKELNNRIKGILKHKEIQANANKKLDDYQRKNKPKRGEFKVDLWEGDKKFEIQDEWISSNTKKHNLKGVSIPVKKVRTSVTKKTSHLPAVEPPHPGMSYNPSYEDHQDLLKTVAEKEVKLIKEEEHLIRCTKGMFQKVTPTQRDKTWLVEMSEGLPSKSGASIEENEPSDNEYKAVNPPARNVKKTLKQRRKQKEQLDLNKERKAIKLQKKKRTDIHKLKILTTQIDKIEKKQSLLRENRREKAEVKKKKTKVLGSIKFEEPDLEFNMGREISGNLKDLKIEGNILADRFRSMQKRNILVPSNRRVHKKPKVKKYTKPGHKDEDWKKTVARNIQ